MKRLGIFVIAVALIAGILGCVGYDGNGGDGSYTLIVDFMDGGTVTVDDVPIAGKAILMYDAGTVVSLSASPTAGCRFVEWTGNVSTIADADAASITITMEDDYSITASFECTIDCGDAPLGETGGLHYVYWDFGIGNFRSVAVNVTVYDEPDNNDGLYFQMYQGQINGVGFYFGIQTDVYRPGVGSTGKGLIFSRWETRDLSHVRTVEGGWSQSAGYEGDFVGIRKNYRWTTHSYELRVAYTETDELGDWYGVWIVDLSNRAEDFLGSIRFPKTNPDNAGIHNGGITWTELYYKQVPETPIPTWHVSIDSITAIGTDGNKYLSRSATSDYSIIGSTDIYYDRATEKIHFEMGCNVSRMHAAGRLF